MSDDFGLSEVAVEEVTPEASREDKGTGLERFPADGAKEFRRVWASATSPTRRSGDIAYRIVARDNRPDQPNESLSANVIFRIPTQAEFDKLQNELEKAALGGLQKMIDLQKRNLSDTVTLRDFLKDSTAAQWTEATERQKQIRAYMRDLLANPLKPLGGLTAGAQKLYAGEMVLAIDALQSLPDADADIEMLSLPHEILGAHERTIAGALAVQIDSGRFRERRPGLFAAAGAEIAEQVVVRHGPVVVDAGAEIGPFVCLDGPIWIGSRARVNPHAWIRAGTAIGAECRVGGEVEATAMEPFSNKPHDGFLGHSHIGSWVNLAAGTITSNLKATYGPIRLHTPAADGSRMTIHTGRQFLGALVGDFVKTSINTTLPCGARIGIAATVGGLVPEDVAAFTNMVVPGG
ncbi:MAG: hypothetical protein WCJ31_22120, partial [Planctomycetia bacterium]